MDGKRDMMKYCVLILPQSRNFLHADCRLQDDGTLTAVGFGV